MSTEIGLLVVLALVLGACFIGRGVLWVWAQQQQQADDKRTEARHRHYDNYARNHNPRGKR